MTPFARSLAEFIAAKSEIPPALIGDADDNLLPTYGLMLLVAKGGKGKTTLVIDLLFYLASGLEWLGFTVLRPLRILFIENEGPREPFRHKLERKRESWEHPIEGGIYIYDEDWGQARLNVRGFVDRLNEFVAEHDVDLVIGDPLDTFGMDGVGSPEDTRAMVGRLQDAGLFSTVAWLMLHHSRKESVADAVDEASGAWGGKPDTLLALSKDGSNRARLSFPKVRWGRERSAYVLAFDPDIESFEFVNEEDGEERSYVAEIAELLADGRWRTVREIAAPKTADEPGIGASEANVKKAVADNRFETRTGAAAQEVGRNFNAIVFGLRQKSNVDDVDGPPEASSPGVSTSTFPYRDVDVDPGAHRRRPSASGTRRRRCRRGEVACARDRPAGKGAGLSMIRRAATPGEVGRWQDFLGPLEPERADAVIQLLAEVVGDCRTCDEPVRRCDSRVLARGELMHSSCGAMVTERRGR